MTATERDREVAAEIVRRGGYRVVDAIAAALASERERALAPVLPDRSEAHYAGMQAVREMPSDWYCPRSEPGRSRRDCPECVAEVALDAALAYVYNDALAAAQYPPC